ncbi:hypothetical protein [Rhodococcus sp. NPDC127528]|uniref:hypothetical protein n=1 Tax=unclassified Rhodococcus (in: high G+C Gram-positive bacteria) TaxID=192944 RepID=UPI003625D3BC
MNRALLVGSWALAVALGTALAPTAAADATTGRGGPEWQPCSDQFVVPLDPQAWTTDKKVVLSPYGTDRIECGSWHGFFYASQTDPQGKAHALENAAAAIGLFGSGSGAGYAGGKVYIWR